MQRTFAALTVLLTLLWAVPASAVDIQPADGRASLVEPVQSKETQQKEQPKAHKATKEERCFNTCYGACWTYNCIGKCRCQCAAEKAPRCSAWWWGG